MVEMKTAEVCNHGLVLVQVSEEFNLERAVCNHGFFMMAPNRWIPSKKCLIRPLRLNSHLAAVTVSISQPPNESFLFVTVLPNQHSNHDLHLSNDDRQAIQVQVSRMLRISEEDDLMVNEFHSVHPQAKKLGFARIFRSPNLFEDIVKSILLCYCQWSRSLEMAQTLCDLQQKLSNRKKGPKRRKLNNVDDAKLGCCWRSKFQCIGNFPSPKEIACLNEETLNQSCNLGYRASIILRVARSIEDGSLNYLGDFERVTSSIYDVLRQRLTKIKGFGPFIVANIMMCLGFYQEIPVDTETFKHLEEVHGKKDVNRKTQEEIVSQIYDKYAPFQCLVYWMEHVEYYEKTLGKLSELPHSKYCNVSSTNFKIGTFES